MLKGDVYGPLALEIEYKSDQVAQVLEDLIPFSYKFAYIVRELDDWQWLSTRVQQHSAQTQRAQPQAVTAGASRPRVAAAVRSTRRGGVR